MIYQFDEFTLDEDRYELRLGAESIRVQPRVLETIAFLIRHRDHVVPPMELLRALWHGAHVSDYALRHAIKLARRALRGGESRGAGYIRTVHGRGFRFVGTIREIRSKPENESTSAIDAAVI